jgi:hypothetical protein
VSSPAPVFSLQGESRSRAESAAWAQFSSARDQAEFCQAWLAILCAQLARVGGALLVLGSEAEGGFSAAAVWPDVSRDMQYLGPVAERALKERRGLVASASGGTPAAGERAFVGYPVEVAGSLHGAVVLDLPGGPDADLQRALRLLHWASAWLVDRIRQQAMQQQAGQLARLSLATDLVATAVQQRRLGASALALVNEAALRLGCHRVSIGFENAGAIEVQALSHTATFDRRSNGVQLIADAMEEVLDLGFAVRHPPPPTDGVEGIAGLSQAELAAANKSMGVCSVPLVDQGRTIGVLTLERADRVFEADEAELCRTLSLLLGPVFALKRENDRGAWRRLADGTRAAGRALVGPGHPGAKLVASLCAVALLLLAFVSVPYRVAAKTVIEGAVQRAAVAPFDGYIAESLVRAGDTVKTGQVLARLLDRDLKLEQARWSAEHELADRRFRQAAAAQDRAAMAMAAAQLEQAQAQRALAEEKINRATLVAAFDGVVVTGDLHQLLGSPVEQGKLLFEIAPLDAYRVILQIDERDVGQVQPGQRGELALAGLSGETIGFVVKQVTPISTSQEGHNFFRVEATIDSAPARLRPGMEGIGKVNVGERKLVWVWTHGFTEWLRLALWRWLP